MVGFLNSRTRLLSAGLLVLSLSVLTGCSSGAGDKIGNVSGKVKVDGALANSGNVVFAAPDGASTITASIEPDGSYRAIGVPIGANQVTVTPAAAQTGGKPSAITPTKDMPVAQPVAKPVTIHPKYGKAASSGLTFTVKGGSNTYDIELASK